MNFIIRSLWFSCIIGGFCYSLKAQTPTLSFIDSVKLYKNLPSPKNETSFTETKSAPLPVNVSDSTIAIADGKLNDIRIYNKFSGKRKNVIKYAFNYKNAIAKVFQYDTAKINYALPYKDITGIPIYTFSDWTHWKKGLLLNGSLMYAIKGAFDTVYKKPMTEFHFALLSFLINTDRTISNSYYYSQDNLQNNFSPPLSQCVFINDSEYIADIFRKWSLQKKDSSWFAAKYKLDKRDSIFKAENIIHISIPYYFAEHYLQHYTDCIFFKFHDRPYAQYCYIPWVQSLENNNLITLPDSAYKQSVFESSEKTNFQVIINYKVQSIYPTSNGKFIYYLVRESDSEYLIIYDSNFKEVTKTLIPFKANRFDDNSIILSDNCLSILSSMGKYNILYNYKIGF